MQQALSEAEAHTKGSVSNIGDMHVCEHNSLGVLESCNWLWMHMYTYPGWVLRVFCSLSTKPGYLGKCE